MFIVICYDIPNDKRRGKIHNELKNFGVPVQESVFECDLKVEQIGEMMHKLLEVLVLDEDKMRIYFLCKDCLSKVKIFGEGKVNVTKDFYIV